MALLSYTGNYESKQHAAAQLTTQNPFANNTETIADLENVLGDQNTHIILNGTNIANPNNTLPDSININIKEDCMQLPVLRTYVLSLIRNSSGHNIFLLF